MTFFNVWYRVFRYPFTGFNTRPVRGFRNTQKSERLSPRRWDNILTLLSLVNAGPCSRASEAGGMQGMCHPQLFMWRGYWYVYPPYKKYLAMEAVCNTYWDAAKGNLTAQNTRKPFGRPGLRPAEGAYSAPANPLVGGEGWLSPPQEPYPRSRPFGPRLFYPLPHTKNSSDAVVVDCYILRQNQGSYAMLTVSALVCVSVYRCMFGCVNKITQKLVDVF